MDLTQLAGRRLHVLVAEVPGALPVRWAAESALADRGWVVASSVADADLLLVCGAPGPELTSVVRGSLDLLPLPRGTAAAATPGDAADALDRAVAQWRGPVPPAADVHQQDARADDGDPGDEDDDDDGGMDMDMDMTGPGGIPLASGAEDRDGLEMDVLHVPLGPLLPGWPAGLVLTCTLAGDVVTGAGVEVLPAAGRRAPAPLDPGALRAETATRLLELAGRADRAADARAARTLVLAGDVSGAQRPWSRVQRTVRRSRPLAWSLRGLGRLDPVLVADHRLPAGLAGDVHQRLLGVVDDRLDDAAPGWPGAATPGWRSRLLGLLPDLVAGRELAEVRLLLAGLPADLTADATADTTMDATAPTREVSGG